MPRVDLYRPWPEGYKAMGALNEAVEESDLDPILRELVKMRASQINSCAYCIDMHSKDARALGESEQRLYALSAWRETPFFSERERAALALTESITLLATTHVPDEVIEAAKEHFSEEEMARLVFAIVVINAWNRLAVTSGNRVGGYQPPVNQHV